jgi:Spy/CpxP family protein refolding chaperone
LAAGLVLSASQEETMMKKSAIAVLAVMLAAAGGARTLLAAGRGDDAGSAQEARAQRSERMLEHMKKGLGLSDAEAAKVKSVFEESRKDSEPLRDDLKVALEKLRWQVDAKAGAKDLAATLEQVDKSRKALAAEREKTIERLKAALPVEAQAKLALFKAGRMRRMRGMGRHGWGGHGRMKGPGGARPDHAGPPPAGDGDDE